MPTNVRQIREWVENWEPIRALVVSLLVLVFGWGVCWAQINARIDNNAEANRNEAVARQRDETTIGERISRGFDKVLDRLTAIDQKVDAKASADMERREDNAKRLGRIEGLLERNYGDIPKEEVNGR